MSFSLPASCAGELVEKQRCASAGPTRAPALLAPTKRVSLCIMEKCG
jgi:hypothetical protein